MKMGRTRIFEVKLKSVLPTGTIIKSEELSMEIVEDNENSRIKSRLFIHIGGCLYSIDKKGFIIDRIVPPLNSNELYKEQTLKKMKEDKYYVTEEQLGNIKHYKRMFEYNAELVEGLCKSEKDDIVYGFELGKVYTHLRDCFMKMMDLEDEIEKQIIE